MMRRLNFPSATIKAPKVFKPKISLPTRQKDTLGSMLEEKSRKRKMRLKGFKPTKGRSVQVNY
jgi:hypothetical protein